MIELNIFDWIYSGNSFVAPSILQTKWSLVNQRSVIVKRPCAAYRLTVGVIRCAVINKRKEFIINIVTISSFVLGT